MGFSLYWPLSVILLRVHMVQWHAHGFAFKGGSLHVILCSPISNLLAHNNVTKNLINLCYLENRHRPYPGHHTTITYVTTSNISEYRTQCRSVPIKILALIPMSINSSQCRSVPLNADWSELIGIDQQWSALKGISDQCHDFDWHWSNCCQIVAFFIFYFLFRGGSKSTLNVIFSILKDTS